MPRTRAQPFAHDPHATRVRREGRSPTRHVPTCLAHGQAVVPTARATTIRPGAAATGCRLGRWPSVARLDPRRTKRRPTRPHRGSTLSHGTAVRRDRPSLCGSSWPGSRVPRCRSVGATVPPGTASRGRASASTGSITDPYHDAPALRTRPGRGRARSSRRRWRSSVRALRRRAAGSPFLRLPNARRSRWSRRHQCVRQAAAGRAGPPARRPRLGPRIMRAPSARRRRQTPARGRKKTTASPSSSRWGNARTAASIIPAAPPWPMSGVVRPGAAIRPMIECRPSSICGPIQPAGNAQR